MKPVNCPCIVKGTVTGCPFTKSFGNTIEPIKFNVPPKFIPKKLTPLMVADPPKLLPIFKLLSRKTPPTFRTEPGVHGEGLHAAKANESGTNTASQPGKVHRPAPPLILMFDPEAERLN